MKVRTKGMLIFGSISLLILFGYIRGYRVDEELKKNGKITIARIESVDILPKWSTIYVSYYYDNKKRVSFESDMAKRMGKKDIGKFYEMKYLPDSPQIIRGNYSKQVTDTTAILKAGFSREEIEGK